MTVMTHSEAAPTPPSSPAAANRPVPGGPGPWSVYRAMLRWRLFSIGPTLPIFVIVQALMAAGIIVGFGLLIPDIDALPSTALLMSTGAPTALLMTVGLVMVPQVVAQARANGAFAYTRALPVPRPILLATDLSLWTLIALPGIAVAVGVAWLRFGIPLDIDWPLLVTASLLVTVMAASVGYAIAVSLQPMVAQALTQVLVFFILLFSPVTFPTSQLPHWFQTAHDWLPIRPAADLLRAGLAQDAYAWQDRDLFVLLVWMVVSLGVCLRALTRR
ncbi:ABC transporter component [Actinomyces sp. Chiba101]|uniref:ABC-2 type transport system permease protein n=1 Tax=Actinomyces denticolens TaxID=52767 RepID=A0ABY1IBG4_9ACTO|nr:MULTISPECIES: ABC transporter permease [Actinomyces]BAW92282.1 ABC transporter component [Actinomyces sp. Chiba101]GAV94779.1 ABC transporter related protein [Actinomyces denticolens]SHI93848.1 ABC-2 type transport system permease protein [Actinomyces denticolens]SUU10111.1 YhgE/Pip C-terminal domain [Actinomyces denticolens]